MILEFAECGFDVLVDAVSENCRKAFGKLERLREPEKLQIPNLRNDVLF